MLHYYIAYGLMVLAAIWWGELRPLRSRENDRKFWILFTVVWTAMLGLRHPSMGADLQYGSSDGYLGLFANIGTWSWQEAFTEGTMHYEQGYIVFNKVLSVFGDDPQILIFVCAVCAVAATAYVLARNSELPLLSALIFLGLPVFLIHYSGLRQSIAIAITLVAFEMIRKKKLLWFILLVLLASAFHRSSIVFLIAYPLYYLRLSRHMQAASNLAILICWIFREPLFERLSKLLKDNAEMDYNGSMTLFLVFWMIYLVSLVFGRERDLQEAGVRNLVLAACCLQAFSAVSNTAMRVGYYFIIYIPILLTQLVVNNYQRPSNAEEQRSSALLYLGVALCFGAFGLFSLAKGSWAMSNPHLFFWQ